MSYFVCFFISIFFVNLTLRKVFLLLSGGNNKFMIKNVLGAKKIES